MRQAKDIFSRFLLNRRNHTNLQKRPSFLCFLVIFFASCILVLPIHSLELYGKIWGRKGFSNYQFLFKSKAALQFLGEALLLTLGVWLILWATNFLFYKFWGKISVKISVTIKKCNFSLQITKRLVVVQRLIFVCIYGAFASWLFITSMPHTPFAPNQTGTDQLPSPWYDNVLVAHAGGGNPMGIPYVNSLEAFEKNLKLGHRIFEGDLCITSDGAVVLEHDWKHYCLKLGIEYSGESPTYEQFMNSRFYGTDTPMDITALMKLMVKYEDMYFMTDYKYVWNKDDVVSGFLQIVQTAKEMNCENVLERFIIQNYHKDFKHWVDSVYPFQNWVYTLYMLPEEQRSPEEIIRYCEDENIPVITMWTDWINEDWLSLTDPRDMKIFVHTENDVDAANQLIRQGAAGIYTDFLTKEQIEILK